MHYLIKKIIFLSVALALLFFTSLSQAANTVIDVLVVYTKGTTDLYGGDPTTRFNQIFQVSNQIYKDSNVDLELRLAGIKLVDYTDDNDSGVALNDITYAKVPAFSGIVAYRDQIKADMVILYRPYMVSHGSCGIAWIGGSANGDFSNSEWKKYMYAHVSISSCGDYVTAHELGHNMGLKHSRKQDGSGGAFPYALGYGVDNQFTTIMAYQTSFNVDYWEGKLYKFSNPDLLCKGVPCGVSRTDATNGADAHHALNITGPQIAKFALAASATNSTSSVKSVISSASSSKSSVAVSSKASSKTSSKNSSVAKSSVSNVALNTLLTKMNSTKKSYDSAVVALNANTLAISQKTTAEQALKNALTKATAAVTTAQAAYNTAIAKTPADANATAAAQSSLTALKAALTKATSAYNLAAKAVIVEKAKTTALAAKVKTTLVAYNTALAAYNSAKALASFASRS